MNGKDLWVQAEWRCLWLKESLLDNEALRFCLCVRKKENVSVSEPILGKRSPHSVTLYQLHFTCLIYFHFSVLQCPWNHLLLFFFSQPSPLRTCYLLISFTVLLSLVLPVLSMQLLGNVIYFLLLQTQQTLPRTCYNHSLKTLTHTGKMIPQLIHRPAEQAVLQTLSLGLWLLNDPFCHA